MKKTILNNYIKLNSNTYICITPISIPMFYHYVGFTVANEKCVETGLMIPIIKKISLYDIFEKRFYNISYDENRKRNLAGMYVSKFLLEAHQKEVKEIINNFLSGVITNGNALLQVAA